jgi:cell division protein FtsB
MTEPPTTEQLDEWEAQWTRGDGLDVFVMRAIFLAAHEAARLREELERAGQCNQTQVEMIAARDAECDRLRAEVARLRDQVTSLTNSNHTWFKDSERLRLRDIKHRDEIDNLQAEVARLKDKVHN